MQSTESVVWCRTLQVSSVTCSLQNPLCGIGHFRVEFLVSSCSGDFRHVGSIEFFFSGHFR
jgi:hypothetical protein